MHVQTPVHFNASASCDMRLLNTLVCAVTARAEEKPEEEGAAHDKDAEEQEAEDDDQGAGGAEYQYLGADEERQKGDTQALAPATHEQAEALDAEQRQQQDQQEEEDKVCGLRWGSCVDWCRWYRFWYCCVWAVYECKCKLDYGVMFVRPCGDGRLERILSWFHFLSGACVMCAGGWC